LSEQRGHTGEGWLVLDRERDVRRCDGLLKPCVEIEWRLALRQRRSVSLVVQLDQTATRPGLSQRQPRGLGRAKGERWAGGGDHEPDLGPAVLVGEGLADGDLAARAGQPEQHGRGDLGGDGQLLVGDQLGGQTVQRLGPELLGVRLRVGELLNSPLTLAQHRDLLVTAGWLSNLLGLLCFDLGDQLAAGAWCTDVEKRADDATHPELAAWAAQTRVLMAFYAGNAREAVSFAQKGQTLAPPGTVAHAKLVAQEMRAWAQLRDAREVGNARRRAEQAIAKLPAATPTQGAFSISRAGDPPYTATSLLLLGQFQEAEAITRQVIASHYGVDGRNGPGEHPVGLPSLISGSRWRSRDSASSTRLTVPRAWRWPLLDRSGRSSFALANWTGYLLAASGRRRWREISTNAT
jgi:hypothetical protein